MALTQSHYRFGSVDGTESTHGWLAGQDRNPIGRLAGASGQFLLRVCVQADATLQNNLSLTWQFRLTPRATGVPGTWTAITTTSSVARTGSNAVFTNGANCTQRLSGTGTFVSANAGCTTDGTSGGTTNDVPANGNTETLIGLQIIAADTAVGDLIEFRVIQGTSTLLGTYAVTPALLVGTNILAAASYDATSHTSQSAAVSKIRNAQVSVWCDSMAAADLADATLSIQQDVWGSLDGVTFDQHLYGPDVWFGGGTGKDGLPIAPSFTFAQDIPDGVTRVEAVFAPSRTVTFGANATVVEGG